MTAPMSTFPKGRSGPSVPGESGDVSMPQSKGTGDGRRSASDPFARLGRFAVRRRWAIVLVWAVILLVAIPLAPRVVGVLRAGGFILDDLESARAKALLQAELATPPSAVVIVYHSDDA